MTFCTELISVKKIRQGDAVGYGATFICPEDMLIGIIAAGYGDGLPRNLSDKVFVLVGGAFCPLIGRISMDMSAIDLRSCQKAIAGDKVILWGDGLPIEKLTHSCEYIPYDLFTGVQNRVKFEWI